MSSYIRNHLQSKRINNDMTKLIFSFDDGREDNFRIFFDVLKQNKIPTTINITTDYVFGNEGIMPCINKPLSMSMLQELDNELLFEIAGHGKQHMNEVQNLLDGVKDLRNVCKSNISGIASPCSQLAEETIRNNKKKFNDMGISYIRLGDRISSLCFVKKALRKINRRFFHIPFLFAWIHEQSLIDENDDFILYSVPVLKKDSVSEVLTLIKRAVKNNKNLILMFHSVLYKGEPEYNSNWSWDWNKFENLIFKVSEMQKLGLLQVVTTQKLMAGK